ncbi:MAG: signal peptidase II [Acidobacteriota bacterium]|nr:signal peptidase II [Acidobacteriota bacterium]
MNRRLTALLISAVVFALDRWSKFEVEQHFTAFDTRTVIPGFFNLIRSENPGVAFGIFADSASHSRTPALVLMSAAAIAVLAFLLWKIERQDNLTAVGLSLIFGGALGNVYDRVRSGVVTDFLDFYAGSYHWYTFNLADSAIALGAAFVVLELLRDWRHPTHERV